MLASYLKKLPLVAILRGVQPDEVVAIAAPLVELGFEIIEVPLNSPQPFKSIANLSQAYADQALIGAGTVLKVEEVEQVAAHGGRLIVMPHSDTKIIQAAKAKNLCCVPGFATPSEAFAAIEAGADGLKSFPADMITPNAIKSMCAVLPAHIPLLLVGGIGVPQMQAYWQAGAAGFGLGSALYKPGDNAQTVRAKAETFIQAMQKLMIETPCQR